LQLAALVLSNNLTKLLPIEKIILDRNNTI